MSKHLWEVEHAYYGAASMYYVSPRDLAPYLEDYESWEQFVEGETYYDADLDMNLLYRWDWREAELDWIDEEEDPYTGDTLYLYYILPRRGILAVVTIKVERSDEDKVREWLQVRAQYMADLWAPLVLTSGEGK